MPWKLTRVAPPPLAFTTQEVVLVRPMLVSASRNWGLLHPDFNARLLLAFKIMKEQHGYEMALLEGYRSPARQDLLAQMGGECIERGEGSGVGHGLADVLREKLLHEPALVGLVRLEPRALRPDQVVERGEALGDFLLFGEGGNMHMNFTQVG